MLHGYMSSKQSFYYQIEYLSKSFKVTAPDFPGFGASAPLTAAWSVSDYCGWLESFVKAAKLDKPHIIAHSFGARVAFKYLCGRPQLAEKLVVTGGAGLVKPRSAEYLRRVKAYRRVKRLFPKFAEKHYGSAEYRALPPLMRESYKSIVNEDLREYAAGVQNKTLLVYGKNDTVTPSGEEGEIFHSLISGSRLVIADGGHFCFSEKPEAFNKTVYEFFTEK